MKEEIEDYIGSCTDCIIRKPEKLIKTSKIIETIQPLYQFIADLYQIPKGICEAAAYKSHIKYKYVLTCVDHFSKYLWGTLIENKKGIQFQKNSSSYSINLVLLNSSILIMVKNLKIKY